MMIETLAMIMIISVFGVLGSSFGYWVIKNSKSKKAKVFKYMTFGFVALIVITAIWMGIIS